MGTGMIQDKIFPFVLRGRKPEKLDKIIYFWLAIVLVMVFIIFLFSSCAVRKETVKLKKMKKEEERILSLQNRASEIESEHTRLNNNVSNFMNNFFAAVETSSFLTHLSTVLKGRFNAGEVNISPTTIQPGDFCSQGIVIQMICSEINLINFLKYLENFSKFIEVKNMTIKRSGESDKQTVMVSLHIRIFILNDRINALVQASGTENISKDKTQ